MSIKNSNTIFVWLNYFFSYLVYLIKLLMFKLKHEPAGYVRKRMSWKRRLLFFVPTLAVVFLALFFVLNRFVFAAAVKWDGGGTDETCGGAGTANNWSCAANWEGDALPQSGDVATFDNTSDKDCTIDAAVSITGIDINTGYDGTITQAATIALTTSGFAQDSGTFNGGSQDIDIVGGSFIINGGTFNSTSGILSFERDFTVGELGTFSQTSGTVTIDGNYMTEHTTMTCTGSTTFNLVSLRKTGGSAYHANITIGSNCNIPLGDNPTSSGNVITNNGTITVGSGTWTINASFTQSFSEASTTFSGTTIDMNSRDLSAEKSTLTLTGGTFTASSMTTMSVTGDVNNSGDLLPTGLTFTIDGGYQTYGTSMTCSGSEDFTKVIINRGHAWSDITFGSDCIIPLGDNPTSNAKAITNNGTVTVGTGTWTLNSAYIQNSASASTTVNVTAIDVNKLVIGAVSGFDDFLVTAGTFSAPNLTSLSCMGNVDDSGSLLPSGLALTLDGSTSSSTVTCGSNTFSSITVNKTSTNVATFGSDCTVIGDFIRTDGAVSNPGSAVVLSIQGSLSMSTTDSFGGANLTVKMTGSNAQTITQNAANAFASPFQVDKTGSNAVSLSTNFTGITAAVTVVEGILSLNGKNLTTSSTFTVEDGGNLQLIGNEMDVTTPILNSRSLVTYIGNGIGRPDTFKVKDWNYSNLTINTTDPNDTIGATYNLLDDDLVNYWKFDEGSGAITTDSYGSNNGSLQADATFSDDVPSVSFNNPYAMTFDGAGDYINVGSPSTMAGLTSYTLAFWIKPATEPSGGMGILGDYASWYGGLPTFYLRSSTNQDFACGHDSTNFRIGEMGVDSPEAGNWMHLVCTWDGSTIKIYINGTQIGNGFSETALPTVSLRQFSIGGSISGLLDYNGLIDDVRIYNRVITTPEISILASGGDNLNSTTLESLTVSGDLTITSGTFSAPATLNVAGNWSNSGTFTHNNGTVVFNGTNQTISGSTTFYNFTKDVTSAATLTFPGDSEKLQTFEGTMTLKGRADNLLTLASSSPGTQFRIDPQGTRDIEYLSVSYSNNVNAADIVTSGLNITNGDNNTGWDFSSPEPSTFKIDGNFKFGGIKID